MPRLLSPVLPGQPITADWANELLDEVRRLRRIAAGPGIHLLQNEAGLQIGFSDPPRLWLFENYEFNSGGVTSDGIRYWQAMRLRPTSSGEYERDASETFTLYDPLGVSTQFPGDAAAPEKTRNWAMFNSYTGRWEIVGARTAQRFAKLTSNWRYTESSGFTQWSVLANPCLDNAGSGVDMDTSLQINLPQVGYGHPNLVSGEIVNYLEASDGSLVCTSAYMDDPITTLKPFTDLGTRIHGWALADGTANSTENGGTGINLIDKFPRGKTTMGATGGSDTHTHDDHDAAGIADHPADVTGDEAAHTHPGDPPNIATAAFIGGTAGVHPDAVTAVTESTTGPGDAHHHSTPALTHTGTLSHAAADNVPAWVGLTWMERLNNGELAV